MTNNSNPRNLTSQMKFLIHQKEKKKKTAPKNVQGSFIPNCQKLETNASNG